MLYCITYNSLSKSSKNKERYNFNNILPAMEMANGKSINGQFKITKGNLPKGMTILVYLKWNRKLNSSIKIIFG